jgi:hypothetical protein
MPNSAVSNAGNLFKSGPGDPTTAYPVQGGSVSDSRQAVLGAGVEHALLNNWSAKVEYNYVDLGSESSGRADHSTIVRCSKHQLPIRLRQLRHFPKHQERGACWTIIRSTSATKAINKAKRGVPPHRRPLINSFAIEPCGRERLKAAQQVEL